MSTQPRPEKAAKWALHTLARPDQAAARQMLADLLKIMGEADLAMALNVTIGRLTAWINGTHPPARAQLALTWWLHSALLHPERVSSLAHILTWGRYAKPHEARRAVPAVWRMPRRPLKERNERRRKRKKKRSN